MQRALPLLLAFSFLFAGIGNACDFSQRGTSQTCTLTVGGVTRQYLLYIPANLPAAPSMLIYLHGANGGLYEGQNNGWTTKAGKVGFIAAYPQALPNNSGITSWNLYFNHSFTNPPNDVGFIRALIDELEKTRAIDPKRVYVTGMSNGGMMTYRLACELSDRIAAAAPVAGALNLENCQPARPVSMIIFHGTADEHVLFDGGEPLKKADTHRRVDKSVGYAVTFWVKRNGCSEIPQREEKGSIRSEIYREVKEGTEVALYTVKGGGHAWPGGESYLLGVEPTREISATDLMWDFFVRHPKN